MSAKDKAAAARIAEAASFADALRPLIQERLPDHAHLFEVRPTTAKAGKRAKNSDAVAIEQSVQAMCFGAELLVQEDMAIIDERLRASLSYGFREGLERHAPRTWDVVDNLYQLPPDDFRTVILALCGSEEHRPAAKELFREL